MLCLYPGIQPSDACINALTCIHACAGKGNTQLELNSGSFCIIKYVFVGNLLYWGKVIVCISAWNARVQERDRGRNAWRFSAKNASLQWLLKCTYVWDATRSWNVACGLRCTAYQTQQYFACNQQIHGFQSNFSMHVFCFRGATKSLRMRSTKCLVSGYLDQAHNQIWPTTLIMMWVSGLSGVHVCMGICVYESVHLCKNRSLYIPVLHVCMCLFVSVCARTHTYT